MNPEIFREYDVRGVVGRDFDADFARVLGQAYVTFLARERGVSAPTVAVGHDARLTCAELVQGLSSGLVAAGAHVVHLGLVTSPMTYFATFTMADVDGAIVVTGSHNPPECNGFKICAGRATLRASEIQTLRELTERGDFVHGTGSERKADISESYVERYRAEFARLAPVPVVLDCGNGAAGAIVRRLYEAVGLEPTILFEEPDGRFPNHHPDPTVEVNLGALQNEVRRRGACVGIGFDGDADRIGVVDEHGRMLYGDELIALYSRFVLQSRPGQKIVADVKCSDRLFRYITQYGGVPVMWKSGHSRIREKVKSENAPFGGELAGHLFFADRNYGYDDALYAGLRLIEVLGETRRTVSELLSDLPRSFNTPEIRIGTTEQKKHTVVEELKRVFTAGSDDFAVNLVDGIRVSFPDGWALARASNTEPVLVLRYEASTPDGLETIRSRFEQVVRPLL
ncbi:MAG TPA: phosphomannomutase/phosphoglucomutase [Burkholderiales bacterium]|nr:phosphomannomutase/phosphoglucomutase [Burkholderiales bacterium]